MDGCVHGWLNVWIGGTASKINNVQYRLQMQTIAALQLHKSRSKELGSKDWLAGWLAGWMDGRMDDGV